MSSTASVRVPCKKCENCLNDKDCGKCKPCKENKKSATTGKTGKSTNNSPPKASSPTQEKQSLKQCEKRICKQLQLSSSAVCATCKGNQKGKLLMECTSCNEITHPKCNKSNVCGVIKSDENNYWVCPKCCKAQCTKLCDNPCPYSGRHHEMIVSLIQSNNVSANDERSKQKSFKVCVEKYIRQGWNCEGQSVPDESPKLRYPLLHLAVLFGKVQVVDWLLQQGLKPHQTCKDQNPDPGSPLHFAVTHFEVVFQQAGEKSLTKRFAEIVNLFLLQSSSTFTYKNPQSQNSFLHFLSQRCLENIEGLAKDYLLATLQKLKENRANVKSVNVKELLCARNAEGNTFLHLIVQNDSLHDIVKYLATNFDGEFKFLSGTKNQADDTPREIAAEKGCVKVCEALGAPAALLEIIAQGNSPGGEKENELEQVVKKEGGGKRKRSEEEQDEVSGKRKKVEEAEKKTSSCSSPSKKEPVTDTTTNKVFLSIESKMQSVETSGEETRSDPTQQINQSSNSKEAAETSRRFENQLKESSPESSSKIKKQPSPSSKRKLSDNSSETKRKPGRPKKKQCLNNEQEDKPRPDQCTEERMQTNTQVSNSLLNFSENKISDNPSTHDQNLNDNLPRKPGRPKKKQCLNNEQEEKSRPDQCTEESMQTNTHVSNSLLDSSENKISDNPSMHDQNLTDNITEKIKQPGHIDDSATNESSCNKENAIKQERIDEAGTNESSCNKENAINQEHIDKAGTNESSCNKENAINQERIDKAGTNESSCNKENAINQERIDDSGTNESSCNKENAMKQERIDGAGSNENSCNKEVAYSTEKAEKSEQSCQRNNGNKPAEAHIILCKIEIDENSVSTSAKSDEEECKIGIKSTSVKENVAAVVKGFPKHTLFCSEDCTVKHSKILVALQNCNNKLNNSYNNIEIFMEVLDQYIRKEGRSVLNQPIPDKLREFRHPIVHWAAVLGKYQLLGYLAKRKDFNLSVSNPRCGNETAIHRTVLFIEEALTREDRAVTMKRIFYIFSKVVDVFVSEALDVFGRQNSDGDSPFHLVAKAIMEVGQNRQLKCYDRFFKIMLEKLAQMAKNSRPEFEKVKGMLGKMNKEGETFLHVLTCRVGIGHELVNFTLAVLPVEILDQLKKVETKYGKTASAIAADLGSNKLAGLLSAKKIPSFYQELPVTSETPRGNHAEQASLEENLPLGEGSSENDNTVDTAGDVISDDMSPPVLSPQVNTSKENPSLEESETIRKQVFSSSSYHDAPSPLSYSSGELWSPGEIGLEDEESYVLNDYLDEIPKELTVSNPEETGLPEEPADSNDKVAVSESPKDVPAAVGVESNADAPLRGKSFGSDSGGGIAKTKVKSEQNDGEGQVTSTSAKTDNPSTQLTGPSTSKCNEDKTDAQVNEIEIKQMPKPSSTSQMIRTTPESAPLQSSTNTTMKSTGQPASASRPQACIISGIMRSPHTTLVKQSIVKSLRSQFKSTLESTEKMLKEEQAHLAAIRNKCLDAQLKKKELLRQIEELDSVIAKAKEDETKCLILCESKQEECERFKFELEKCETSLGELAQLL